MASEKQVYIKNLSNKNHKLTDPLFFVLTHLPLILSFLDKVDPVKTF